MWLLILLLPSYVVRFSPFGLPLNLLMVSVFVFWIYLTLKLYKRYNVSELVKLVSKIPRWFQLLWIFLFVWSFVELCVSGLSMQNLGQWLVIWFQPLVSVPLVVLSSESKEDLPIFSSVLLVLMLDGIVSILQYFFLLALPPDYWGNSVEPKRAIGLFVHPNAHSLFITPLLSWVMPFLYEQVRLLWEKGKRFLPIFYLFCFAIGVVGLFLSLSRGGWLGFAFACVVFVFAVSSKVLKKIFLSLALFSVIFVLSVPVLRYRVALPFYGEKSAVARLSLWNTAGKMIKDSPLFGKGVNGFNLNWDKYNSDPGLLHYNFPHNIFLNFWVDFGLPGMIAFISLCCVLIWKGVVNKKQNRFALPLVLALIAILAHGLIDIPYLKNDLALMFWLFVSFYLGWMVRNDHLNG